MPVHVCVASSLFLINSVLEVTFIGLVYTVIFKNNQPKHWKTHSRGQSCISREIGLVYLYVLFKSHFHAFMTTLGFHLTWAHVGEVMEREKRQALFQFTEPQFFINHSLLTMTYRKIALMKSRICRQQPPGG